MGGLIEGGLREADQTGDACADNRSTPLTVAIARAVHILTELGPGYESCLHRLDALGHRLREERFHLALLGQFKRGKSTLLNALLGANVLPTSVVPLTAIPTFVHYGPQLSARVILHNGETGDVFASGADDQLARFLAKYVTEKDNPRNRRGVREVEVEYPAHLLQRGVVLIDTPGIGSTFRHNTEATLNFLPQCDAALFIVSPDPPITEVEVEFLKEVLDKTARTVFVLNKIDYLSPDEAAETVGFFKQVLKDQIGMGEGTQVFCVSARQGLQARLSGNERGWVESGMQAVQEYLVDFLANQKSVALEEAISRKVQAVMADAALRIGLSVESLRMPVALLEEKMELLQAKLQEVESQRVAQLDVLDGDRRRMADFLEEQAAQLRRKARLRLLEMVQEACVDRAVPNEDQIREKLSEVIPAMFERELGGLSRTLEHKVQEVFSAHRRRTDELVDGVRRAAAELFKLTYDSTGEREAFEIKQRPYWVTHQWGCSLNPLPDNFLDRFLPARVRRSRAMHRLRGQIEAVVSQNVENVRWPTLQNLEDAFRKFAALINEQYHEVVVAMRESIEAAYVLRKERAGQVEADVARLESAQRGLDQIRSQIQLLLEGSRRSPEE